MTQEEMAHTLNQARADTREVREREMEGERRAHEILDFRFPWAAPPFRVALPQDPK